MSATFWIILAGAAVTYLTRIGGHLALSRFTHVHPRVEAALDAAPAAASGGPAEIASLIVAALAALRGGMLAIFLSGGATLVILRHFTS